MTLALLFDLDGTLIHSDPIHAAVFIELFAEYGREIDERYYYDNIHGRRNEAIFGDAFPDSDPQAMADEKEARFRDRLGDSAEPMAGLMPLLDRAACNGWPCAIVTNAPRANADAMLAAIGLNSRFDPVVIGDELPRGKPDPLPYQTALDRLGIDAGGALALDDSPSGVASASAARVATLGVRSSLPHDALIQAGAHDTIADFTDPVLDHWIAQLTKDRP
ncbi:Fructose-1-phosphate phosphatase YqaB [Rhodobacteraceae bacterium THAF1]|uniref:HAD family hydrolase n=1 Tax=Palleronia sp. THAF1 TaxID=2587842 RepID=UPI000F3D7115|nr:HAD-IA family hydrolase [Palleronia sp. THAF1]QFU08858.1 Fructose-1-phosphate phosphatase YqaB [Palleronia sp. THAF1]VDC24430.1 Fructose-1-phosphate phosphatase YqaB [Rhodobacteraceae bacterium THAF1]